MREGWGGSEAAPGQPTETHRPGALGPCWRPAGEPADRRPGSAVLSRTPMCLPTLSSPTRNFQRKSFPYVNITAKRGMFGRPWWAGTPRTSGRRDGFANQAFPRLTMCWEWAELGCPRWAWPGDPGQPGGSRTCSLRCDPTCEQAGSGAALNLKTRLLAWLHLVHSGP